MNKISKIVNSLELDFYAFLGFNLFSLFLLEVRLG